MLSQESNREKQVLGTQQNSLEVEIIDLMRLNQPEAQSIFITRHIVPELYNIAKERRKASLILIDHGVRYSLRSVHIPKIETDGAGRMTCYYVD
jgi:hypothetical protein